MNLRVYLDAAAAPQRVEVASSSGDARLDEAARQEVAHWTFAPRLENGGAVATDLHVRVVFTLNDEN